MAEADLDTIDARHKACIAKQKVAVAQVAQKEAALRAARVRKSYTRISAAWEGGKGTWIVGQRLVNQGAMLRANDPIVSLLDMSELTAVISVAERDYPKLTPGQSVAITTDAFPDKTFAGTVQRVAPLVLETSREARVEITTPNPDLLLRPGMYARASIEFARHDDATTVPFSSLAKRGGKQGVFLVMPAPPAPESADAKADPKNAAAKGAAKGPGGPGTDAKVSMARFVPVTVGIVNSGFAEILDPPLVGDVITLGHHLVEDGSRIILSNGAPRDQSPDAAQTGGRQ